MCPLRIILIFLSATLAGILVLKNFKSVDNINNNDFNHGPDSTAKPNNNNSSYKDKVMSVIGSGFWGFVDMASGRYLWRYFAAPASSSTKTS